MREIVHWLQWRQDTDTPKITGRSFPPAICIQIVLPEDTLPAKSCGEPAVRHSGDEIRGHLEVTTCGTFNFEVTLAFEGVVRTWLGLQNDGDPSHLPPSAELQFLQETQKLFSDSSIRIIEGPFCKHRLPFRFIVPHQLISAHSDVHSDFLKLSPSTKQGHEFWAPTTKKMFRQPMIVYMVRIKRITTDKVVENFMRSTYQREIAVMPHTPLAPPLSIEAFPREYKPCVTRLVRQHRWTRPFGSIRLSAAEPPPLNVLASRYIPSTTATLSLAFIANRLHDSDIRPCEEWNCEVRYYLRIRTFYSTRKMQQMPTFSATKRDPYLEVREIRTTLEIREYSGLCWSKDDRYQWKATLKVPIRTIKKLLPTFLNQLSARQYAIVVQLSIKGLVHGVLELVLPLQVVYYPGGEELGDGAEDGDDLSPPRQEFMASNVDLLPPPYEL
ncbi:uncharacterized protein LY89DRAFT_787148 [Mollisia scopiformis]|uniref:Arrestin-like N-terminal domain-containing protein n=1 Tax=Mollisia scopiformis TaxID=149040 RepID=A0A194WS10_MOLSC|nr:uncharacterized protein LY89DRAFT_787148 [Mollisia scopiformis]KUJ10761.1 hypothetical protein LY89DRAFT_787148 [Mollisia scopiformis]